MTRTTWRSICHARAVTIALSLVRQSMDLGCATRAGAFRETKILTGRLRKIFRGLTSISSPSRKQRIDIDFVFEGCTMTCGASRVTEKTHIFGINS